MGQSSAGVEFRDEQAIDDVRQRSVPPKGVLLRRIERFLIEVERDVAASSARARSRHMRCLLSALLPR